MMDRGYRRSLQLVAFLVISLAIGGCSLIGSKPQPDEAVAGELAQRTLFLAGWEAYDDNLYSAAREKFRSFAEQYAGSPFARLAEIKAADCTFEMGQFSEALTYYEAYLKDHPTSEANSYVRLRAGRSAQLAYTGLGRDSSHLLKAIEHFDHLSNESIDSEYNMLAGQFRAQAIRQLAAAEMTVLEFYRRQGQTAACKARERQFQERWGQSPSELLPDSEQAEEQAAAPSQLALNQ